MPLQPRWSISCRAISLAEAAERTGMSLAALKQLYREGVFGSPRTNVTGVPMHEIASILVLKAAQDLSLPYERVLPILDVVAGAAYVKYQLTEIAEGRCNTPRGTGTPDLNIQLGVLLRSPEASSELEARLPGGPIPTKRYACFERADAFVCCFEHADARVCDDLEAIGTSSQTMSVIDAWDVAKTMKQVVGGERLYAVIA